MAMKTYDFAYGRGRKTFTVEEDRVLKVVRTEEFPPMEDIRGGVLEAIRHPIGCPSIEEIVKPGDTVAFICNDPTRVANSFDFMPVLVEPVVVFLKQMRPLHNVCPVDVLRPHFVDVGCEQFGQPLRIARQQRR